MPRRLVLQLPIQLSPARRENLPAECSLRACAVAQPFAGDRILPGLGLARHIPDSQVFEDEETGVGCHKTMRRLVREVATYALAVVFPPRDLLSELTAVGRVLFCTGHFLLVPASACLPALNAREIDLPDLMLPPGAVGEAVLAYVPIKADRRCVERIIIQARLSHGNHPWVALILKAHTDQ
ncbi:hypothetical protein SB822_39435 [Paraburkholderia sp. SIMBA_054]